MSELWITGMGVVSAIGVGKEETKESLLASQSGIGPIRYLKTEHTEFPVGEVKLSNEQMLEMLGLPQDTTSIRTALMGTVALKEALDDARLTKAEWAEAALVSGTTVGGMDKSEQYYLDFLANDSHNEYIKTHDCGSCSEMTADYFGPFASITTLSTACSSAANAIIYGARLIESGKAEMAIVGGSECLSKFHLNGFNSLMILDECPCRPFDASRKGLNLGEGAAYLVIETKEHGERRGVRPRAILAGYGNACDAFHQTASSADGEGAYRAMCKALAKAGVEPSAVDYINAHGTGTPNNDASESAAMRRLFGEKMPPVSSTKSFTGHTTSASGSIESVISLLAMEHGFIPANLNFKATDDCITPVTELRQGAALNYVLCNSFGFGGNDSALLFARPAAYKEKAEVSEPAKVRIYAASQVSIQNPLSEEWMDNPIAYTEPYNHTVEPDYKQFIPPLEARRMGKLLKRALVASKDALAKSGIDMPDAIVSGTGLGCIENTELFLKALCIEGESLLKPTQFMQSTHNTIGSLLAIQLKCHGYNATYAHKNISFDSALNDAYMQVRSGEINSAMVGGFDEMTPSYFVLLEKLGYLGNAGECAGEAAASVVIGNDAAGSGRPICTIEGIEMMYCPTREEISRKAEAMMSAAGLKHSDMAGVLAGWNGAGEADRFYDELCAEVFPYLPALRYKNIFGECYTASGLALYAAVCCMKAQRIPDAMYVKRPVEKREGAKAWLLCNYDDQKNCTLILLNQ